jgi:hypothetical protein
MIRSTRYELHITRAAHWARNRGQEITAEEWWSLVNEDPDLVADPSNGAHAVVWSRPDRRVGSWFDWCEGNIYTANPDHPVLGKVLGIARLLGARVEGDDGTEFVLSSQALPIWDLR